MEGYTDLSVLIEGVFEVEVSGYLLSNYISVSPREVSIKPSEALHDRVFIAFLRKVIELVKEENERLGREVEKLREELEKKVAEITGAKVKVKTDKFRGIPCFVIDVFAEENGKRKRLTFSTFYLNFDDYRLLNLYDLGRIEELRREYNRRLSNLLDKVKESLEKKLELHINEEMIYDDLF